MAIIIIIGIVVLIIGYFFVKYFGKMNTHFFSEDISESVLLCEVYVMFVNAGLGAICGGVFYLESLFDWTLNRDYVNILCAIFVMSFISFSIYFSVVYMSSVQNKILKAFFSVFTIVLAFGIGYAGSIVVLAVLTLCLTIYIFYIFIKELLTVKTVTVKDKYGNETELSKMGFEVDYSDSSGSSYDKSGDEFTKRN